MTMILAMIGSLFAVIFIFVLTPQGLPLFVLYVLPLAARNGWYRRWKTWAASFIKEALQRLTVSRKHTSVGETGDAADPAAREPPLCHAGLVQPAYQSAEIYL
jgi:hypothetical protein